MPYGEPNKLAKQEYVDVIAYMLKVNGFEAGERELPPSAEVMKAITILVKRERG
jgi:hypothetical protein